MGGLRGTSIQAEVGGLAGVEPQRRPSARRLALAGLVTAALCGCGSSGAPPVQAPPPSASVTTRGAAPVDQLADSGAAVRAYLAEQYVGEPWYPRVERVSGSASNVLVEAALAEGASGRAVAGEICGAVLSSGKAALVTVEYPRGRMSCRR